jgi:1,4-dihydroxy-2-naphthoate octaprenyltransferase
MGRSNLPIVLGKRRSGLVYGLFLLGVYLSIVVGFWLKPFPAAGLLGLLTLPLAVPTAVGTYRYAENTAKLVPYLAYDLWLNVFTPLMLAAGLLIAAYARTL